MDIRFEKNSVTFVWNAHKSALNLDKHGVTFEQATTSFFDPFFKLVDAARHDEYGRLLFVVHIEVASEYI